MEKPLSRPNLPQGKVCTVAVSDYSEKLTQKLAELNIKTIITASSKNLDERISHHTDMLLLNYAKGRLLYDESQKNNIVKYLTIGYRGVLIENKVKSPYPDDSRLNVVFAGDRLICNPQSTDEFILRFASDSGFKIIPVNQGYTKCSVCLINDNALITDDESIHNACTADGIDSLLISKGSVKLNGFDYGFIGGCTGLIDKNKLLFNGDVRLHSDADKIFSFLNIYNIEPVIIENEPLYDIGGIIPLTENTP